MTSFLKGDLYSFHNYIENVKFSHFVYISKTIKDRAKRTEILTQWVLEKHRKIVLKYISFYPK